LGVGGHALMSGCPAHWTIRAKMHRMITMHAHPRQTDEQRTNIMAKTRRFVL